MADMSVLLIGLDGAPWSFIETILSSKEDFPFLFNIICRGAYGLLKSTIPCNTCPALPSLYTGKNAGNIGIFDFVKPDGSLVTFNDFKKHKVFWQWLGDFGYSSLLFGTRLTEPVQPLNGYLIPDDTFVPAVEHYQTYPENIKKLLKNNFFLDYGNLNKLKKKKDCVGIYSILLENIKKRFNILFKLISTKRFDFVFLWIGHTDLIQHHCWGNKVVYDFFKDLDGLIRKLVSEYKFRNIFVVSDHGFGTAAKYNFHLNEWLYREGYLKMKGGRVGRFIYTTGYKLAELVLSDNIKKKILFVLRRNNKSKRKDKKNVNCVITLLDNIPGVDWNKTVAHVTTDKCWGIRIIKENLDRDYEVVRDEIIKKLKELRDPRGRKVIKDAWRGEEIYWGEYEDQIPDIIFLKEDIFKVRPSIVGKTFTKLRKKYGNYVGNHDSARDGIFIAFGEDIVDTGRYIGEVQIYDVAPTILYMYGIEAFKNMDGRVLFEIFKDGFFRKIINTKHCERNLILTKIKKIKKNKKL